MTDLFARLGDAAVSAHDGSTIGTGVRREPVPPNAAVPDLITSSEPVGPAVGLGNRPHGLNQPTRSDAPYPTERSTGEPKRAGGPQPPSGGEAERGVPVEPVRPRSQADGTSQLGDTASSPSQPASTSLLSEHRRPLTRIASEHRFAGNNVDDSSDTIVPTAGDPADGPTSVISPAEIRLAPETPLFPSGPERQSTHTDHDEHQPTIRIHIGRLDVRAATATATPRRGSSPNPATAEPDALSLADYLAGRRAHE